MMEQGNNISVSNRTVKIFFGIATVLGVVATATTVIRYFEDREHNRRTRNISKMQEKLLKYQLDSINQTNLG